MLRALVIRHIVIVEALDLEFGPGLTTLTGEFFVPGFLERDEGEREQPFATYPWDGISGVRPFSRLASATTVGVY